MHKSGATCAVALVILLVMIRERIVRGKKISEKLAITHDSWLIQKKLGSNLGRLVHPDKPCWTNGEGNCRFEKMNF